MTINDFNDSKDPKLSVNNFNDERLRRAIKDTKSAIAERNRNLDRISEDIKKLERYLDESGVRETIQHCFDSSTTALGEPWELEFAGEAAAEEVSEFLVWEERQTRWRITYLKTKRHGGFSDCIGWYFEGEPEVIDHRPLIEAPAIIRLRASEVLPDLVKAIARITNGPKTRAKESGRELNRLLKVWSKKSNQGKEKTHS